MVCAYEKPVPPPAPRQYQSTHPPIALQPPRHPRRSSWSGLPLVDVHAFAGQFARSRVEQPVPASQPLPDDRASLASQRFEQVPAQFALSRGVRASLAAQRPQQTPPQQAPPQ